MDRRFEQGINGEPLGVPQDLFTDPAKYDADIPLWKRTVGFVKQYERSKPKGRDKVSEQLASFVTKDLSSVVQIFENFSLIESVRPDLNIAEIKAKFLSQLENSASRHSVLSSWTPDKIEQLAQMGLEGSIDTQHAFRLIQRGLFNAPKTVNEGVNLYYNTAWAMVQTDDFEVKKHLFSLLCFEQEDIISTQSRSAWLAELGLASPDDAILSKSSAYSTVLRRVGILIEGASDGTAILSDSRRFKSRDERMKNAYKFLPENLKAELNRISLEFIKHNRQRVEQLVALTESKWHAVPFESITVGGLNEGKVEEALERRRYIPPEFSTLAIDPKDPLCLLSKEKISPYVMFLHIAKNEADFAARGYQKLLDRCLELPQGVELQVFAKGALTPEQKAELIREVYLTFSTGKIQNPARVMAGKPEEIMAYAQQDLGLVGPFDRGKVIYILQRPLPTERLGTLGGVLEYHRPAITLEQMALLKEQIKHLRQDLTSRFTKGVGRRGYLITFSDPVLRRFGYESLLFKQDPDNKTLKVAIRIKGQIYEFRLDFGYRVKLGGDHLKKFKNPLDQDWLEVLVLSHLKKLICTGEGEEELKQELLGGERQLGLYRRQQVHRIEHLRKQIPGKNFTQEAFQKCLKSHLPMKNLLEINRLRAGINWGGTLKTGIWTYVSGIEKDIDTQTAKPIKVAFSGASDDLRTVIPLGEVSSEELSRIENEILGELKDT